MDLLGGEVVMIGEKLPSNNLTIFIHSGRNASKRVGLAMAVIRNILGLGFVICTSPVKSILSWAIMARGELASLPVGVGLAVKPAWDKARIERLKAWA